MKTDQFRTMGLAAMLPGMQYMLEKMQALLVEFREELNLAQEGGAPAFSQYGKRLGRPPKDPEKQEASSKFDSWVKLTPAERAKRSRNLSDAQRRVRGLPPKTGANGQALLATGWPADPEERRKEMKRRMAKWAVSPSEIRKKQIKEAKKELSPQARGWANMTPEARAKRAAKARRSQKIAVATLRGKKGPSSGGAAFWAKLSPAERTAEMQRRNKVAQARKAAEARA